MQVFAATIAVLLTALWQGPALVAQQLRPAGTGGIGALDRALAAATRNARVLLIAAHPDDEDTELLTLLSRGYGIEVAYLSLSRGEGGQNLIGPELGEHLGIIRSGELVAARSIDGGRQFFTRAFDFGFSRSLEEAQRFWPRDSVLADVVRVIRRFRPHILVSVWTGTPRDGHGQHQYAGWIAREAFRLTRDSAWGPRRLYRSTRFDTTGTTISIPSGLIDPVDGRSYLQLAMASRSLHRSQDMGQLQRIGPSAARLGLVEASGVGYQGSGAEPGELFSAADTALAPSLVRYAALVDSARSLLSPRRLAGVVPLLAQALSELRRNADSSFRAAKEPLLVEAILTAASVVVDATADDGRLTPGQTFRVGVRTWNAGQSRVRVAGVRIAAPPGWQVRHVGAGESPDGGPAFFTAGQVPVVEFEVTLPADAEPSTPYFLRRPLSGAMYDWTGVADPVRSEPFDPPLLEAVVELEVDGLWLSVRREVAHRFNDQAQGEIRRPLIVVPRVGVSVSPALIVWPARGEQTRGVTVELVNGVRGRTEGTVRLELPPGWPEVAPQPFVLDGEDTRRSLSFTIRAPRPLRAGGQVVRAVADLALGSERHSSLLVDYPHIRPVAIVRPAELRLEVVDLVLPTARRIGYVRGASDAVPEALAAVGLPLRLLTATDLERGDLAQFDVIVIGSRAYETDTALVAANGRLLDWVRAGGRLVVQYQQYQFVRGNFAPLPLRIAQPHDRVTDETAPVTLLDPNHRILHSPNRLTAADWSGWVQERGLYFAREWDAGYTPLLEMGDNGARLRGGLLVAQVGRGIYVYTGIAFFRQLPAGVPGAFRLFMNLLER